MNPPMAAAKELNTTYQVSLPGYPPPSSPPPLLAMAPTATMAETRIIEEQGDSKGMQGNWKNYYGSMRGQDCKITFCSINHVSSSHLQIHHLPRPEINRRRPEALRLRPPYALLSLHSKGRPLYPPIIELITLLKRGLSQTLSHYPYVFAFNWLISALAFNGHYRDGQQGSPTVPFRSRWPERRTRTLRTWQLSKSLGIISKAQWVKTSAWVKWVNDLSEWSAGNVVAFNGSHQNNLSGPDRQGALGVDQAWVAQVVESTFAENLSSGLEPHCLAELDTVAG
ncbi:hypothetical protein RJ640_011055 [Escallonia rubra]|uniref:Uncharacterized protein n=1 Tax=Escallonia rubra TaxID=112253 RepID=A0AA88SCQ7_9ASTE|nr:hypothetical protein RJ640_011055 [Escallonia rubra]